MSCQILFDNSKKGLYPENQLVKILAYRKPLFLSPLLKLFFLFGCELEGDLKTLCDFLVSARRAFGSSLSASLSAPV